MPGTYMVIFIVVRKGRKSPSAPEFGTPHYDVCRGRFGNVQFSRVRITNLSQEIQGAFFRQSSNNWTPQGVLFARLTGCILSLVTESHHSVPAHTVCTPASELAVSGCPPWIPLPSILPNLIHSSRTISPPSGSLLPELQAHVNF